MLSLLILCIYYIQANFAQSFENVRDMYRNETESMFHQINTTEFPPESNREVELNANFREFVDKTVPGIIEKLQGSVTRHLKKSHETFDIDNTKLLKREKRIVERFDTHRKVTTTQFSVEKQKRLEKFLSHDEEMIKTIRVDDRQSEQIQSQTIETVRAIRAELQAERDIREKEDLEILGKLADAMAKLQQSILTNFGENKE